jgi:hypothetical protein
MTTLATWVGGRPAAALTLEQLVLRYLRAFGPASAADVRTWSSLRDVRPVLARLAPELRSYRDEGGRELHDVRDGVFPDPSTPAPVRFLPQFDNVFLSHADRGRIMTDVKWDASFARRGALFVDGFLGGAWSLGETRRQATLTVELRTRIGPAERRHLRLEAEELLLFVAADAAARKLVVRPA